MSVLSYDLEALVSKRVSPKKESGKIVKLLERSNLRGAKVQGDKVVKTGFMVGYDARGKGSDISIHYEPSDSTSATVTNAMLTKYENALRGTSYRLERHDDEHNCSIAYAHVHVYLV